jgi:hypothetical protein
MIYLILHPREIEAVQRATAKGQNGVILDAIKLNLNTLNGELDLTPRLLSQIRVCYRRWRMGGEQAFKAVLAAVDRHCY